MTGWLYNLVSGKQYSTRPALSYSQTTFIQVNIGVALCGYYLAALLIDNKFYGRTRMQSVGFFANWLLFVSDDFWVRSCIKLETPNSLHPPGLQFLPAVLYNYLREPAHIHGFQAIYFLSGFFQQFGPNWCASTRSDLTRAS
jgi:hypothetical protein